MPFLRRGDGETPKLPKELQSRIQRGRERLEQIAVYRDEAWEFYRGNHFAYVDEKGILQSLPTTTSVRGKGKPKWRARQTRNLIFDNVLRVASAHSQRVPSFQVVPSTNDPEDVSSAKLSEKIAHYGYYQWHMRRAIRDAVIHCAVAGEVFSWPYFDNTIGPLIDDGEGNTIGQGDVRIRLYGANECYWEPGLPFEDSPWHVVEHAMPVEQVEQLEGFMLKPGKITPDADSRALSFRTRRNGADKKRLVLVSNYLERPSPTAPDGKWVTMANGVRIVPDRDYPGNAEEPVLRKLSYAPDPDNDRDLGLVAQLMDGQRTYEDVNNKLIEWKNLALNPQWAAAPGVLKKQRRTDEPGKVYEVPDPERNLKILAPPTIPKELFEIGDRAQADMARIAAQNDIPSQVESGRGIESLLESDRSRGAMFLADLADWDSRVMHDCLVLVQRGYTEERLIKIKGSFGWESIEDFKGSDLRGQVDVRVFPDSIEPLTRQAVENKVMLYADRGWISPEQAIAAMEVGNAEAVIRSIAQDEARAGRIIQRIKEGPEALGEMPELPTGQTIKIPGPGVDPMTGQPQMIDTGQPEFAPGWMPRFSDNLPVFRAIFEDWMKTEEFERLEFDSQNAAAQVYAGTLYLEAQKAQQAQEAQMAQAESLGMENATRPTNKGMPDQKGIAQIYGPRFEAGSSKPIE